MIHVCTYEDVWLWNCGMKKWKEEKKIKGDVSTSSYQLKFRKRKNFSIYVRMYISHNRQILRKWKLVRRILFSGSDFGILRTRYERNEEVIKIISSGGHFFPTSQISVEF